MSFLQEFRDYKTEDLNEEEKFNLYFRHMVGTLSAIADELHAANKLKLRELEDLKKRRV